MKEKAQLEKTIETLRENSERQVHKFPIKHSVLKLINKNYCIIYANVHITLKRNISESFRF